MRDFAKIVTATNGQQVLYYVEPDDGDYLLHQVIHHEDGFMADMKIGFKSDDEAENERRAFAVLEVMNREKADTLIAMIDEMVKK